MKNYQTARLSLEPLSFVHTDFVFELLNSEGWKRYIGDRNIQTQADAIAYIEKVAMAENVQMWVVQSLENPVAMGIISVIQRDYLPYPDIGFAFLAAYAGKNYAYEAAFCILEDLLTNPQNACIYATTLAANTRSILLLQRLGLSFEREMQVEKEHLCIYVMHNPLMPQALTS